MENIISFDDVIKESINEDGDNKDEPAVLLGNGYSIALKNDIFSYEALKSTIDTNKFHLRDSLHEIFDYLKTSDFEKVIKILEDTNMVNQKYSITDTENIKADSEKLKQELISSITAHHPSGLPELPEFKTITNHLYSKKKQVLIHIKR